MMRMAHIVTDIRNFDNKRNKVTLDYGEVTFLLYKGECRKLHLKTFTGNEERAAGTEETAAAAIDTDNARGHRSEITDEQYRYIFDEILLPRAKKRVLYYLKNADKTREQIRRKLREGMYPEQVIRDTFEFLDKYGFADDRRYAESYTEELKGTRSKREIEQKLRQRGISRETAADMLNAISPEDEYEACTRALAKKYPRGVSLEDKQKAYAFLARKFYSFDAIEHAMNEIGIGG